MTSGTYRHVRDVQVRVDPIERLHASGRHLGAAAEVEGLERRKDARTPSSVTLRQQVRSRDVIAGRLLTARSASSVNTAPSPLDLQRHHRREAPHHHAHGLVGGLPSQHQPHHQRIVHGLPPSANQPHRGGGLREPQAALLPPSRLQQLQHIRQQLLPHIRPPALRLPPPLCSQHRGQP
jgi:hypothetical protein